MNLLPRLSPINVEQLLDELEAEDLAQFEFNGLPDEATFAATGGSPVSAANLKKLRLEVLSLAKDCGFPEKKTARARAEFDEALTIHFGVHEYFRTGEAYRDDVWAFIATALLPDLTVWRFSLGAVGRFQGGVRNTFQRLWLRAQALDKGERSRDRWEYIEALSEDALVQITERPSIGGDPLLAKVVAQAIIDASKKVKKGQLEKLVRDGVIQVRLRNEIYVLSALDETETATIVGLCFDSVFPKEG